MNVSSRIVIASIAVLLTGLVGGAQARPTFGPNCAGCHDRPAGSLDFLPAGLLEILPGDMGQITFDVTALGSVGEDTSIAVFGLDAAALMATPDLTGWNSQSGGTFLSSDFFNTTGQVPLKVTLGAGATLGDYPIDVQMAGGPGGDWSTTGSYVIRVIPEPATIVLFSIAIASGGITMRRRLIRRKSDKSRTVRSECKE